MIEIWSIIPTSLFPGLSKVDLYLYLLLHKQTDLHYMNNSAQ